MARRELQLNAIDALRTEDLTSTTGYTYSGQTISGCTFIGYARPGTLESDTTWLIKRIHVIDNTTYITYAETYDGAIDERICNKSWTNRYGYFYEES